jgi:hypothetical protein
MSELLYAMIKPVEQAELDVGLPIGQGCVTSATTERGRGRSAN